VSRSSRAHLGLIAATLAVSASAITVRLAQTDATTVVWLRMALAVLLLLPWAARDLDERDPEGPRDWRLVLAAGAALAVHFLTWTASLGLTSVAASVLLVSLHPVMVALLGARWLGERLGRAGAAGIALALAGTLLTCGGDLGHGPGALSGDLLALVGAAALAAYLLIGRRLRRSQGTALYSASVYAVVAVAALGTGAAGGAVAAPSPRALLAGVFLAAVCTVGGHTVFNWALRHVPASTVSVAFLAEPPLAALLALLLLREAPPAATLAGAPLILGGMALCLRSGRRPATSTAAARVVTATTP
jgi:drug/metabolite transporter (DMT)-like permease